MSDQGFSPHKIFAASEGTLGILTSARLKILDIPLYRHLLVLGFGDLLAAVSEVPRILRFSPVALEMLDHTVVSHGEKNMHRQFSTDAGCILFVEFAGDRIRDTEGKLKACKEKLSGKCTIIESVSDEQSMTRIWEARKGALNRVMRLAYGSRKPIGLIEDTVVKPSLLHAYTQYLLQA